VLVALFIPYNIYSLKSNEKPNISDFTDAFEKQILLFCFSQQLRLYRDIFGFVLIK
jgi:hypothetical protein